MTSWDNLVSEQDLVLAAKGRKETKISKKVKKAIVPDEELAGWVVSKEYKNGDALMEKSKPIGDQFENFVWTIFYKMGFKILNATNEFKVSYSKTNPSLTQQIDVIAIDDEVCLYIECKATEKYDNKKTWKNELESIYGYKKGVIDEISAKYPGRKHKFIFATQNYVIGHADEERMKDFEIANFTYETLVYYEELVNHLGTAARYQLLGNLFAKQKIKGMDCEIPAIEGKMGNLTYYSFSIEPERLLKIAYILHRNNANHDMMPTYQRIVKKDRLKAIREFIDEGGYFPNSLIISIDTNGRPLQFDVASARAVSKYSRIGILHLPQAYQSAYVIDGQHRLYGYSDSIYASNNAVPVIAFVDMDKSEQVKMFMDINENQKSVSKSLRNTLNIDLLWESKSFHERRQALILHIGQKMGEDPNSPLYGRVVTGENKSTDIRCITIESLRSALDKSSFFNRYKSKKNNTIIYHGTFDKEENDITEQTIYPFLVKSLNIISEYLQDEWNKGSKGFITINNCMFAIIRVIDDIVNMKLKEKGMDCVTDVAFIKECEDLIYALADTLDNLDPEAIQKIKESKGGSAEKTSWRTLQVAFHNLHPEYTNEELEAYIIEYETDYNLDAQSKISELEKELVERIKKQVEVNPNWLNDYLPEDIRNDIISRKAIKENNLKAKGDTSTVVSEWEFISFTEIIKIISFASNWSTLFQKTLLPEGLNETRVKTASWIKSMGDYKNRVQAAKRLSKSEYDLIEKYHKIFCLIEEEV